MEQRSLFSEVTFFYLIFYISRNEQYVKGGTGREATIKLPPTLCNLGLFNSSISGQTFNSYCNTIGYNQSVYDTEQDISGKS